MVDRRTLRKSLSSNFTPTLRDRLGRVKLRLRQTSHLPALWAGGTVKRPIFIIGAPRSGTSLLYAILRTSTRLGHWPGEAHEVWESDYHPVLRSWESNVLTADDVTGESAERIRRSFFLVTGTKRRLIDKTPRNSLRIPFIETLFPDARYVYLQRDGRDNVNSLINAWRTPRYRTYELPEPHSIPGVDPRWWKFVLYPGWRQDAGGPIEVVGAKQWVVCNDLALESSRSIPPGRWTDIRYERMVADPVAEIGRVMDFLELPYEDAVRHKAERSKFTPINTVTPPEAGKWRRENPAEIQSIMPLLRPTMEALGYTVDDL